MSDLIPVLTIDGPSGSGKGTVSRAVARALGWHFLDSGAIYRSLGIAVLNAGVSLDDIPSIVQIAKTMDLHFTADDPPKVLLNNLDISNDIASELSGNTASKVAAYPEVRTVLFEKQRAYRRGPGLVADGRDMGTVVFKEAKFKVFLTASAEVRAQRRFKQLSDKGNHVTLEGLTKEIEERDRRDRERTEAPLIQAEGALYIDSSHLDAPSVIQQVLSLVQAK